MTYLPPEPRLIYGFDPLCGWCYGFVPALRAVAAAYPDLPIDLALPGLVTGSRIGPYAAMEGYIRNASTRLKAVTGRAPSDAFFRLITTGHVTASSAPPALVLDAARRADPQKALQLAHLVIEAHFAEGRDLNDPVSYLPLLAKTGLAMDLPDLTDAQAAQSLWQGEAHHGITSFPTLIVQRNGRARVLPSVYDPAQVVAMVGEAAVAS